MPTQGTYCKHYECDFKEGEEIGLDISCKKEHSANGKCIVTKVPLDCPDYEAGILISLEEVRKELNIKEV